VVNKRVLLIVSILVIAWGGFVIAAYFVAHKPFAMQVSSHLANLAWTLIVTSTLMMNAFGLGRRTLKLLIPDIVEDISSLVLAGGIGLGVLGLLGFGLAIIGATGFVILLVVQILLLSFFTRRGEIKDIFRQLGTAIADVKESGLNIPAWMKLAALIAFTLTLLRTLLPPVDAFDALLYHLTIPNLWIRDGGLQAYNFPHYWLPGLVEGVYLWGLGLDSEIAPQQIHLLWAALLAILLWSWARKLWGDLTAWWTLMLLISMPSLLLLASWAYTDLALSFFGVAMLFALWLGTETNDIRWWKVSAIAAGMAMGVKYTSFVMPAAAVIIISIWKFHERKAWLMEITRFGIISGIAGLPWYLRNWVWMGNPFYPFVFGGRYWDSFRAAAFAGAGTGTGWDPEALLSLPLTITLGYQDVNYFDGNIGPLFLFSFPMALLLAGKIGSYAVSQKKALGMIGFFTIFSTALWVYGYITTKNLWQTRLLLPAIIPFAIPAAAGMVSVQTMDTKGFRASFIVTALAATAIFINLLDASLGVIARNPLAVVTGIVARDAYFEKYQPGYFSALQMISQTPANSKIYSLLEPRSYGSLRSIQPDTILDNFSHDVFLYKDSESAVQAWRTEGYTHVLLNIRGANLYFENNKEEREILDETMSFLNLLATSPDGGYALYEIQAP